MIADLRFAICDFSQANLLSAIENRNSQIANGKDLYGK